MWSFVLVLGLAMGTGQAADQEKPAKPAVYDEAADARADLAAALARAKKENKRVLVQWGANWCGWCIKLHELSKGNADIAKKLLYEYEVVRVDVGQFDKNLELAAELGASFKEAGVPFLTVLSADGEPLVHQETGSLEVPNEPRHDPAKVLGFLAAHQAPYLEAQAVFDAALQRAKAENKRLLVHVGAPWCGWCHRLEDWMALESVAAVLAVDFIDLKLDQDRMLGSQALLETLRGERGGGIPWIALLDAQGRELAASNDLDSPQAPNAGFPQTDREVAWFGKMLAAARVQITDAQIEALKASLIQVREERERAQREAAERKKAGVGG